MSDLPFSQACENNKDPILEVIKPILANTEWVLEIGSGTGQHAVHFAHQMPHLKWQPSDQAAYLPGINAWRKRAQLSNLCKPVELDVRQTRWPLADAPAIFTANTLHIMHWPQVVQCFAGIANTLRDSGHCLIYGPFNYQGKYTSESNARFDNYLQAGDPGSGIRDFEAIAELAREAGLLLRDDHTMPANNRLLHWQKCCE